EAGSKAQVEGPRLRRQSDDLSVLDARTPARGGDLPGGAGRETDAGKERRERRANLSVAGALLSLRLDELGSVALGERDRLAEAERAWRRGGGRRDRDRGHHQHCTERRQALTSRPGTAPWNIAFDAALAQPMRGSGEFCDAASNAVDRRTDPGFNCLMSAG